MQRSPIFVGVSQRECWEIVSVAREQRFPPGAIIFCEDDPVRYAQLMLSGRVKTTQLSNAGKEVILRIHSPGEMITLGAAGAATHPFSASAMESCTLLAWDTAAFERLTRGLTQVQYNAQRILTQQLRLLEDRFRDLATERVPQRLARVILHLIESSDQSTRSTTVMLSCENLAQMTGTTLFTVSRLLCRWAELGIIQPLRKTIVVEDREALIALAAGCTEKFE